MKTFNSSKITKTVRTVGAVALIASFVFMPATSSAGPRDRAQEARTKVTELKNNVRAKVEDVKDQAEDLKGDAIEQLLAMVLPMIQFMKKQQEGYKTFVGTDDCGQGSPCDVFRKKMHTLIVSFITLPKELPFVESVPPAVRQLEELAKLVGYMPTPMLYAAEKVLSNAFDEIQYRLDMLRFAASKIPPIPTMSELSHSVANSQSMNYAVASSNGTRTTSSSRVNPTYPPDCPIIFEQGMPHIELLLTAIETVHETIKDTAEILPNEVTVGVTAVGGGAYSVKHPAKGGLDVIILLIKTIERDLKLRLAIKKSTCAVSGYQAP